MLQSERPSPEPLFGFNRKLMTDSSGWTTSAEAWIARIDTFDFLREVLLDAPMLRLCGPVTGQRVLDIGCGEGRFSRMLAAKGAETVGLDPTAPLLDTAKARHPEGTYVTGSGEDLPFEAASFDTVVFYLTLIDIPDFRKAIAEAARVLKSGGRLVIGNLASHASTSPNGWVRDENGNELYFPIDNYMDELAMEVEWAGIKIINYHRPLSAYMDAFLSNGLILREYIEPVPTADQIRDNPSWAHNRRVPYAVAMLWEKPNKVAERKPIKTVAQRETRCAIVSETVYPSHFRMPRHGHEPAYISMVLAGGFEESLGAAYQDVDAPTVLFRPQEAQHAVRFGAVRTRILSVQLDPSVAAMARSANIPINQPAQLTGARTSWLVARLYEEFRRKDPIADLAIDALILEMLVELGRAKPESIPEGRLKRLEEILRARLHEKPSLDELARELGMHPVSVARAFRRSRGCTIGSYVRRLRLEKATKMLANGDLSLAEIAGDLGFSDQAHFSRTFKAETGLTPGQCRRAYLRG